MPAIGQSVGKYRIVRLLGTGGMGAVYEVENPEIGQRGALKVLKPEIGAHLELFQRFINEARAANQVRHPSVVKVFDFGYGDDGSPWLVMEYLEGDSLAARITAALRLPGHCIGPDGLWMLGELASVLGAAQRAGITHRDLKPGNVMLVPDPVSNTGERIKLLDFGIAKLHDDSLTQTGQMLGTPVYMAPEQFKNAAEVNSQADVYGLGVIAYQILCGRLPFEAEGVYALMAAKAFDSPTPIEKHAPSLAPEVRSLVMRMLEREPKQRPTIAEVEAEIRRLLGLPPPRESGFHARVDAAQPPLPETLDDDISNPTADAPLGESDPARRAALAADAGTPSEQRAAGELSPAAFEPPKSLSSMPSVRVGPLLRAAPEYLTAGGAPEQRIAAALTSPSAPTSPGSPRGRGVVTAVLGLALVAGITAAAVKIGRQPAKVPAQGVEADLLAPAPAPVEDMLAPSEPPPDLLVQAPPEDLLKPPPDLASPSRPSRGACVTPADSCIGGSLSGEQQKAFHDALVESGTKLCQGEAIVVTGRPTLQVRGVGTRRDVQPLWYALRGHLAKGNLAIPARVEIRCKGK